MCSFVENSRNITIVVYGILISGKQPIDTNQQKYSFASFALYKQKLVISVFALCIWAHQLDFVKFSEKYW